ncbi:hypothetical protein Moror_17753 [Moniliophthora roreri MCA 2997]|uniref:DUF6593 domain-containing protein n=1 Tax=Moniliophthora roreri (strain MCA 2997) TaxID=1381753 RepID=V2XU77_MONRO|nr:hypothetical protein Moror_17753 [Moniliophthora roreri MCA 2997]
MPEATDLVFKPNNVLNTKIFDGRDGKLLYEVTTETGKPKPTTIVKGADGQVVASWEGRDLRSHKLRFGSSGSPISARAWLKKSRNPFSSNVTFDDPSGRTFKWRGFAAGFSLALYCDSIEKDKCIARFHKSNPVPNEDGSKSSKMTHAKLVLDETGKDVQDMVIASFLMLERDRRGNEQGNETGYRDGVLGRPDTAAGAMLLSGAMSGPGL